MIVRQSTLSQAGYCGEKCGEQMEDVISLTNESYWGSISGTQWGRSVAKISMYQIDMIVTSTEAMEKK